MITETLGLGIEDEGFKIEDCDNGILNPQPSILNSLNDERHL
jgi:hypothetical protein